MTPPPVTAASGVAASRRAAAPAPRRDVAARVPDLRVVGRRSRRVRRRRIAPVLAAFLVVGSLLSVVVGHAVLAEGQVRLSKLEASLTAAKVANRQDVVSVAHLEAPTRIVSEARQGLHMTTPQGVRQVPYVPLDVPLPTPKVSPAQAPPSATSSGSSSNATAGQPTQPTK